MGYTLGRFRLANRKQENMEKKLQKKLSTAHRGGNELLQQFNDFHSFETGFTEKFLQDSKEKEIMKMIHIQTKLHFMTPSYQMQEETHLPSSSSSPRSHQQQEKKSKFGEGSFLSDFNKVRNYTKESEEYSALITIYEVKWYVFAIYRLRDLVKRLNNTMIPLSLIRILLIFRYLIILHFPITFQEFYYLLLIPEIFPKDDICKSSVQEIIMEHIKVGLGISSEDFLHFLEEHDFQIPSELLNEIRNNAIAAMLISNSKDGKDGNDDKDHDIDLVINREAVVPESRPVPESVPSEETTIQVEIIAEIIPPVILESKVEIIEVVQPEKVNEIEIPETNRLLLSKAGILTEDQSYL
jgi:hypothetical protein